MTRCKLQNVENNSRLRGLHIMVELQIGCLAYKISTICFLVNTIFLVKQHVHRVTL